MTQSTLITEPGNGTLEIFALPTDTDFLQTLITDIFENYWNQIHFGVLIQGAAWEVRAPNAPQPAGRLSDRGFRPLAFPSVHRHLSRPAQPPGLGGTGAASSHRARRTLPTSARGRLPQQLGIAAVQRP